MAHNQRCRELDELNRRRGHPHYDIKPTKLRVRRRVTELSENPYLGIKLIGELAGYWKDRVGKYRIIYKIDEISKTVVLYDIDLRKRIYE